MNEWGFAGEVKSWWDAEFKANPGWSMARCEIEKQADGSAKRSDIVVYDTGGGVMLAGELRLPDHPQASPYHPDNLANVINKAISHGAEWAFTSDGNTIVLLDIDKTGRPLDRIVHRVTTHTIDRRKQLDASDFLGKVEASWRGAIGALMPIVTGGAAPPGMAADEVFIEALRALLAGPVAAVRTGLDARRTSDPNFSDALIKWMVDEQGWIHNPADWDAELQRAAQIASYVFTTRLMFYAALRRAHPALAHLSLPTVSAAVATAMFKTWFGLAQQVTGDYETLFSWDAVNDYALVADDAVPGWSRVLEHLEVFDLSTLGYDVVGRIFERLIEPTERYRWGQHYTKPEVVDLMLAFAIPDGDGAVLDPAVGGGTFLVRAYERKRELQPQLTHQDLLESLYGLDISSFAANLATINLAARRLEFEDNYPRVAARSFFKVDPASTFMSLPSPESTTLGLERREIAVNKVKAVVCNPPYVRRHLLDEARLNEAGRILGRREGVISTPTSLHKLSNYHVYFWFHAASFIEPNGTLAFITAGEWFDSDYGVELQRWLLENFSILAVIESFAEPWFSEARVGTVVTIAQHTTDKTERENNLVRFVTVREELRDLYAVTGEPDYFDSVDAFRDRILSLEKGHGESDELDWSVVRQGDLHSLGTEQVAHDESEDDDADD